VHGGAKPHLSHGNAGLSFTQWCECGTSVFNRCCCSRRAECIVPLKGLPFSVGKGFLSPRDPLCLQWQPLSASGTGDRASRPRRCHPRAADRAGGEVSPGSCSTRHGAGHGVWRHCSRRFRPTRGRSAGCRVPRSGWGSTGGKRTEPSHRLWACSLSTLVRASFFLLHQVPEKTRIIARYPSQT
jgi:hypothetical protein